MSIEYHHITPTIISLMTVFIYVNTIYFP